MAVSIPDIVSQLSKLSVMEVVELKNALEKEWDHRATAARQILFYQTASAF